MNAKVLILGLIWPWAVQAQGFAGLATEIEGFALPAPDPVFDFPSDHGAHPDFRIEWWYLTANLTGQDGAEYGLQWTLFRTGLAPGEAQDWASPQVWFGHAAVTSPEAHFATERFARGGIGQAGVVAAPFEAWIDDWRMAGETLDRMSLSASGPEFRYDVTLEAQGPLVFHGAGGYSVKSAEGMASYYYSQPFYTVEGVLQLPGGSVPVTGTAWLDREWSSQPLTDGQLGWDWFSLSFDSGDKLMAAQMRQSDGRVFSSATWIEAGGNTTVYSDGVLQAEPLAQSEVAGRDVPTRWQVRLPERGVDVTVEALNPQAWMDLSIAYWEGPVRVSGSHAGRGYLEMTGYE